MNILGIDVHGSRIIRHVVSFQVRTGYRVVILASMNFTIRPVQESDAQLISEMLNAIIATGKYTILEPVTPEIQLEFIQGFPERGVFLVAEREDGKILGLQDVSPTSSWCNAMRHVGDIATFIAMDEQGQGVGRALAQGTLAAARAKGFEKLIAMIRGDNPRAIGFYVSQGFKIVGTMRRHAKVNGHCIDEVIAEKMLE
jgi:L-amino acid N-acyltransferase YncA